MPVERAESSNRNSSNIRSSKINSRYFGSDITKLVLSEVICMEATNEQLEATLKSDKMKITEAQAPHIYFPISNQERDAYRTKAGKRVTSHQWDVYDFAMSIPKGKVTTYKEVASTAGGSPRSVGNALRNNPFAPYVPCHRVIASNFFVGGFFGEWGKDHKTGTRCNEKLDILSMEGVQFDDKGYLLMRDDVLWKP